jgi:hypothetical protein
VPGTAGATGAAGGATCATGRDARRAKLSCHARKPNELTSAPTPTANSVQYSAGPVPDHSPSRISAASTTAQVPATGRK